MKTNPLTEQELLQIKDKKLRAHLERIEDKFIEGEKNLKETEILLTQQPGFLEADEMEKTFKFSQQEIKNNIGIVSAAKAYDLKLPFGSYTSDYTRNGQFLLLGSSKGHLSSFDWKTGKLLFETHLKEKIHDVKFLLNQTMIAVAQKKHVFIYDNSGSEIHCLRRHSDVFKLDFLPFHHLLTSIGDYGVLRYHDTSIGHIVAEHKTKLGPCKVMCQNPMNAIITLGHTNGTVTLWSPNIGSPLVKMLCHKAAVTASAIDPMGLYLTTAGIDGKMNIWDLRTYKKLYSYKTLSTVSQLSISQKGLIAVGHGPRVTLWKDSFSSKQKSPYMSHIVEGETVSSTKFCPFDDILGVGHTGGFSSLIIPGAGEPNFDAFEANPFQTKKQRQESEVKSLLEKIQPELIALDSDFVGKTQEDQKTISNSFKIKEALANNRKFEPKKKSHGKGSAAKRYLAKRKNVIQVTKHKEKKPVSNLVPKTILSRFDRK